jgi:murein DD-endopeptidase MepM/ murein hydrolase activator NlpD
MAIIMKFKISYVVTINEEQVGYVKNQKQFESIIQNQILEIAGNNIEYVSLNVEPKYEIKLLSRTENTNEDEIISILKENTTIVYKFYEVALDNESKAFVDTIEEAENIVNNIKEEYGKDLELDIQILEKFTENEEEVKTDSIEVAENSIEDEVKKIIEENSIPSINGVKLAQTPVSGIITSRYGAVSSIRSSSHTGLDIACSTGTQIHVVADGKVIFAEKNGSYGNLIKVDHGNGVETWYAHCSKLYAKVGETVKAGDTIAAVGSTGNSTGPHLHLEIRINGNAINPQNYLYN